MRQIFKVFFIILIANLLSACGKDCSNPVEKLLNWSDSPSCVDLKADKKKKKGDSEEDEELEASPQDPNNGSNSGGGNNSGGNNPGGNLPGGGIPGGGNGGGGNGGGGNGGGGNGGGGNGGGGNGGGGGVCYDWIWKESESITGNCVVPKNLLETVELRVSNLYIQTKLATEGFMPEIIELHYNIIAPNPISADLTSNDFICSCPDSKFPPRPTCICSLPGFVLESEAYTGSDVIHEIRPFKLKINNPHCGNTITYYKEWSPITCGQPQTTKPADIEIFPNLKKLPYELGGSKN